MSNKYRFESLTFFVIKYPDINYIKKTLPQEKMVNIITIAKTKII